MKKSRSLKNIYFSGQIDPALRFWLKAVIKSKATQSSVGIYSYFKHILLSYLQSHIYINNNITVEMKIQQKGLATSASHISYGHPLEGIYSYYRPACFILRYLKTRNYNHMKMSKVLK